MTVIAQNNTQAHFTNLQKFESKYELPIFTIYVDLGKNYQENLGEIYKKNIKNN